MICSQIWIIFKFASKPLAFSYIHRNIRKKYDWFLVQGPFKIAVKIISKITSQELIAIVGPCLNKENFEVEEKFKDVFITQDLHYENFFSIKSNQLKPHFDMRGLINYQLQSCTVNKISNVDIDTYSNEHLFFSHRRSSRLSTLPTGRLINLIGFRNVS